MIRWKHARERIDLHEAYYWMDKEEEIMWAKDKICFQHLVLNEMKRSTNTDNWVCIAGMVGTEIEVARTIEAWMQRRGGLETETRKKKRGLHQHFPTDVSGSSQLHQAYCGRNAPYKENEPRRWSKWIDQKSVETSMRKETHKLSHQEQQDLIATPWDIWERIHRAGIQRRRGKRSRARQKLHLGRGRSHRERKKKTGNNIYIW
jgi:hypothetical protein